MNEKEVSIRVRNLTISYDKKPVLWALDFFVPKNTIAGIIGPNGSGKTTLLKSIMKLIPISSGKIEIFNKNIYKNNIKIGYIPQRNSIDWSFPASVIEIVLMGRYNRKNIFKKSSKNDLNIAKECLEKVKMLEYYNHQIGNLSGGQQQRILIARALAQKCDLYIMDEPFTGVDMNTEENLLELLKEMKKNNKTILIVHHNLNTVKKYFDWVLMLNNRLISYGKTKDVLTEKNLSETYSSNLNLLSEISHIAKKKSFLVKEK